VPKRLSCARIRGRNSSNFLSRAPLTNPYSHSLLRRCPTSRDFVPWRFLDAGQLSVRSLLVAGVQKPAQQRKWSGLFDHLGGAHEERRRDREAKRFGGSHVDDEVEARGTLKR
jgi:hypothetical protein